MMRIRTRMRYLMPIVLETSAAASDLGVFLYGKNCSRKAREALIRYTYQLTVFKKFREFLEWLVRLRIFISIVLSSQSIEASCARNKLRCSLIPFF